LHYCALPINRHTRHYAPCNIPDIAKHPFITQPFSIAKQPLYV